MTVKELIEELQKWDPELIVTCHQHDESTSVITEVSENTYDFYDHSNLKWIKNINHIYIR